MVWSGNETLIKATNLTGTTGVGLGITNINYGITNNIQIPKPPSTSTAQTVTQVKFDYNNVISMSGVIDSQQATSTNGGKISWDMLEDIAQSESEVYLKDEIFTAGAWQEVIVQSVKASRANDSKSGHFLNYSLVVVKTA